MTPLETVVLTDAQSIVTLAPSRGGIVTRFSVAGRELLFLDESTLLDPTKNIRGGNPILFPSPGPLTGNRFTRNGLSGSMKQHGLARLRPWEVTHQSQASATLALRSDAATRAEFPWDFELTHHHVLESTKLTITQRVHNVSDAPMPFAMGFHPYFSVPDADKGKTSIPTAATRAWDNVAKRPVSLSGAIPLNLPEVDLHLEDHHDTAANPAASNLAILKLPDGAAIEVSASAAYRRWVVWTLAGKDFVCLEPWTAPGDALNSGEGLLVLEPGAATELFVAFRLV